MRTSNQQKSAASFHAPRLHVTTVQTKLKQRSVDFRLDQQAKDNIESRTCCNVFD